MGNNENNNNNIEINISNEDEMEDNKEIISTSDDATPSEPSEQLDNSKSGNNYLEQLLRLQAEFINYKKRIEREKFELSDYLKSELVSTLLPILDDFDRLLHHSNSSQSINESDDTFKGVQLIYQNLLEILKKEGLKTIDSVGQKFDPRIHEALLIDTASNGDHEIVAEEWKKGYLFKERLLRPAQVKVAKTETAVEN